MQMSLARTGEVNQDVGANWLPIGDDHLVNLAI